MGPFDAFRKKNWEEVDGYHGDTPPCPQCGTSLTMRYTYSEMYCDNCKYGLEDDDESSGALRVHDAASI